MEKLADEHFLITGGAGFIGSEVTRQLEALGADITVLDNFSSGKPHYMDDLNVKIIRGDVRNRRDVSKAIRDQDVVVHLAALPFIPDSYVDPEEFFRVNTMGTVTILRKAIRSRSVRKLIHVSSSEVYGTAQRVPMDETHPTLPHSTYAVSKLAADRAVFALSKEHGFPSVVIRPFNTYGPRVTQPYIIPEIVTQLLRVNSLQLGNINASRDFTYVSDTARGIVLSCEREEAIGETINLGSGKDLKIRDLALIVAKVMGKKQVEFSLDDTRLRPYDVDRLICDYSKAQKLLGWNPTVSLEDGLLKTIQWIKENAVSFREPFRGWPRALRSQSKGAQSTSLLA